MSVCVCVYVYAAAADERAERERILPEHVESLARDRARHHHFHWNWQRDYGRLQGERVYNGELGLSSARKDSRIVEVRLNNAYDDATSSLQFANLEISPFAIELSSRERRIAGIIATFATLNGHRMYTLRMRTIEV